MKQNRTVFILFSVLGVIILLYFIFNDDGKKFQWYENYRAGSDQPYGTLFIKRMLEDYQPTQEFIFNERTPVKELLRDGKYPANSNYVFIGQSIHLDSDGVGALVAFMEAGGDAFIACLTPPEDLVTAVYRRECDADIFFRFQEADFVRLNFFHDTLRTKMASPFAFRYGAEDRPYSWSYINEKVFCDSTEAIIPLGHLGDVERVNFIKLPVGKGNLYLHSSPLAFTNYFLTKPKKLAYASGVFSHLGEGDVIWDEYSKIPFMGNQNAYNSPLYYILQQPSLKYAWWLLLLTVAIYIVFAARRRQRIIPVLEPKTNTSLEFIKLISRLHFQNGNHVDMARKKMKYFLYFVRSKYGIHAEAFQEPQILRLSDKSKVALEDVSNIFRQYYLIEEKFRNNIEANRLLDLYFAIDNFYKQCK
jgi:hypothetical protein